MEGPGSHLEGLQCLLYMGKLGRGVSIHNTHGPPEYCFQTKSQVADCRGTVWAPRRTDHLSLSSKSPSLEAYVGAVCRCSQMLTLSQDSVLGDSFKVQVQGKEERQGKAHRMHIPRKGPGEDWHLSTGPHSSHEISPH